MRAWRCVFAMVMCMSGRGRHAERRSDSRLADRRRLLALLHLLALAARPFSAALLSSSCSLCSTRTCNALFDLNTAARALRQHAHGHRMACNGLMTNAQLCALLSAPLLLMISESSVARRCLSVAEHTCSATQLQQLLRCCSFTVVLLCGFA